MEISRSGKIKAIILDFFCNYSFEVPESLGIPTYYFITGGLSGLTAFLYLPTLHKKFDRNFKDLDELLCIPGIPPFPAKKMPIPMLDRSLKIYNYFLETAIQMPKSAGIIVNAIETLEPRALKAIQNGDCTPEHGSIKIYSVGPLIPADLNEGGGGGGAGSKHECLIWLDSQPSKSVVFLTFGSIGRFSGKQLGEIAVGLEKSGVRFVWVVRAPPTDNSAGKAEKDTCLEAILPEGFLERTKNRGLVIKDWAPQGEVLSHDAVDGFVTHCGWNSIYESVRAGVLMLGWALYAEQNLSELAIVEELKVGFAVAKGEDGLVSAAELERGVAELMDPERSKELRERVLAMRKVVVSAFDRDGPSRAALDRLVQAITAA